MSNLESNSIILGYLNSVGSSAGSCYINGITVDVTTLPPASFNSGKIYIVLETIGSGALRNQKGLYYCNGTSWVRLGDIASYFNDALFELFNNEDISKRLGIDLNNISSGMKRYIRVPDHDINFNDIGTTNEDYWSAAKVIDYLQKADNIPIVSTVVEAEALGDPNVLVFVEETETYYQYFSSSSEYIADHIFILLTVDGGNTRWLAISGKYVLKGVHFKEGILTSIIDCGNF